MGDKFANLSHLRSVFNFQCCFSSKHPFPQVTSSLCLGSPDCEETRLLILSFHQYKNKNLGTGFLCLYLRKQNNNCHPTEIISEWSAHFTNGMAVFILISVQKVSKYINFLHCDGNVMSCRFSEKECNQCQVPQITAGNCNHF